MFFYSLSLQFKCWHPGFKLMRVWGWTPPQPSNPTSSNEYRDRYSIVPRFLVSTITYPSETWIFRIKHSSPSSPRCPSQTRTGVGRWARRTPLVRPTSSDLPWQVWRCATSFLFRSRPARNFRNYFSNFFKNAKIEWKIRKVFCLFSHQIPKTILKVPACSRLLGRQGAFIVIYLSCAELEKQASFLKKNSIWLGQEWKHKRTEMVSCWKYHAPEGGVKRNMQPRKVSSLEETLLIIIIIIIIIWFDIALQSLI